MECCKCKFYGNETLVTERYTDKDGNKYCIFHAPMKAKNMTTEEFNERVFEYIDSSMESIDVEHVITLNGFIFPGAISFKRYSETRPIPFEIVFRDCTFNGNTVFDQAVFAEDVTFDGTTFEHNVSFGVTKFNSSLYFKECQFNGFVEFRNIEVQYCWDFTQCKAADNAIQMIRIDTRTLATITSSALAMHSISYSECIWPDEIFSESMGNQSPQRTEADYRSIKQKAANGHDQPMVSWAHYREKRARLKGLISDHKIARKRIDQAGLKGVSRSYQISQCIALVYVAPYLLFSTVFWKWASGDLSDAKANQTFKDWISTKAISFFDNIEIRAHSIPYNIASCLALFSVVPYIIFTLDFWYWATSGFGEKEKRAGIWLAFLLVLPLVLQLIPSPINTFPLSEELYDALNYIPFTKDLSEKTGWLRFGQGASQLLIALQTTIFAFALRNRFRR